MKHLSTNSNKVLEDIGFSLNKSVVSKENTLPHGSIAEDGKTIIPFQERPQWGIEDVRQMISIKRSVRFWTEIREGKQKSHKGSKILDLMLIPSTCDQAAIQIAKLLAHYPSRDATKDTLIIDDISQVLVERKAYLVAIAETCEEIWQESSNNQPFRMASGEIVKRIMTKCRDYDKIYIAWKNPKILLEKPKKEPEIVKMWNELNEDEQANVLEIASDLPKSTRTTYLKSYEAPDDIINPNVSHETKPNVDL